MKPLNKRKLQAFHTKNLIYNIAIELIEKKGYSNITIQEICQQSNVSVGTFYHYYKSKSDILSEIYKKADEYFFSQKSEFLNNKNPLKQIIDFFVFYAKYNENIGIDLMKELYTSNNKMFIQKGRNMQIILNSIVEKCQIENILTSQYSNYEISNQIFIYIRGQVYDWCLNDGSYNLKNSVEKSINLILKIYQK